MGKLFIVVAVLLSVSGCGKTDLLIASVTGYSQICIDGVQYLQFTSGVTVEYSPDGKVKTCK